MQYFQTSPCGQRLFSLCYHQYADMCLNHAGLLSIQVHQMLAFQIRTYCLITLRLCPSEPKGRELCRSTALVGLIGLSHLKHVSYRLPEYDYFLQVLVVRYTLTISVLHSCPLTFGYFQMHLSYIRLRQLYLQSFFHELLLFLLPYDN